MSLISNEASFLRNVIEVINKWKIIQNTENKDSISSINLK